MSRRTGRWAVGAGAVVVAAALAAGSALVYSSTHSGTVVTAYFRETVGVYPGSDVDILGVPVGTVDSVRPAGTDVRVTMTVNHGVPLPAGVDAAVVAPSVIADRYVQLTPAYTSGREFTSGAVIPVSRTAVPVEVDQVYASLSKLAAALGPHGVNAHGALSGLVKTGAANLSGDGQDLNDMITEFSGLSRTLGSSSGNLFATITSLERFTSMLKTNNSQVALAETQLSQVSAFLASDRQDLTSAIGELATALTQVRGFIAGNRGLVKANVRKLATITAILVAERTSLAEALDTAPLAADDLVGAYDTATHTLQIRGNLNELSIGPNAPGGGLASATAAAVLGAGLSGPAGAVPAPDSLRSALPPLPLPATGPVYGTPQALLAGGGR